MSPRQSKYTEQDDEALQAAIEKQTRQGKGDEVEKSIGAQIRQGRKENA